MKRKLFLAINPPKDVKKKLLALKEKFSDVPAKWTEEDNIHMTLFFIGTVTEEEEEDIGKMISKVSEKSDAFSAIIESVSYGPPDSKIPRMIWGNIEKSEALVSLKKEIDKESEVEFHPHINLAKINTWGYKKLNPDEIPIIEEELNIAFKVDSIELMESKIIRGKVEYEVLESFELRHQL